MPLTIDRIQALCIDVDGTLSNTDDLYTQKINRWLRPVRRLVPNRNTRSIAREIVMSLESPGNFIYGLPDLIGIDHGLAILANWVFRRGIGWTTPHFLLINGVIQALQRLLNHYPMSIVSARGERTTRLFLRQFHLEPFFQEIATAQTCLRTKPFPDPVFWAAEKMGVAPERCLMVGDTRVDIAAGKSAGAQTVGVLSGFGRMKGLEYAGADLILPSIAHLPDILQPAEPG